MSTTISYFLQFYNLPKNYEIFLNSVKLKENDEKIMINQQDNILFFKPINNNSVNNFIIAYNVSIEANYSSKCTLNLPILPCYHSCNKCYKSDFDSDE